MIEARGWKLLIFNRYENLLLTLVDWFRQKFDIAIICDQHYYSRALCSADELQWVQNANLSWIIENQYSDEYKNRTLISTTISRTTDANCGKI